MVLAFFYLPIYRIAFPALTQENGGHFLHKKNNLL